MALHQDLAIYRETKQLLEKILLVARNIPRDVKRVVGEKLRDECLEMTVSIYRANVAQNKVPHIHELRERLQVVELILRTAVDMRWISRPQYSSLVAMTQSIGRQATGWMKQSKASPAL
jgi:hypothetical protein